MQIVIMMKLFAESKTVSWLLISLLSFSVSGFVLHVCDQYGPNTLTERTVTFEHPSEALCSKYVRKINEFLECKYELSCDSDSWHLYCKWR